MKRVSFINTFVNGVLSSAMLLIQQSSDDCDKLHGQGAKTAARTGSRFFFLAASLCSYLLFALYTSDLTATMTAGIPPPTLASFGDVLEAPGVRVAYVGGTSEEAFMKFSKDRATRRVFEERSIAVDTYENLVGEIERGGGLVVGYGHSYIPLMAVPGKIRALRQFANAVPMHLSMAFQLDSDLAEAFRYRTTNIHV